MNIKKASRLRRSKKARAKISQLGVHRLCVNKSSQHIYAQIISPCGGKVLATASTVDKTLKSEGISSNVDGATKVGALIAERAKAAGIEEVAFDRSGYKFHGRVKALANAAREAGLKF